MTREEAIKMLVSNGYIPVNENHYTKPIDDETRHEAEFKSGFFYRFITKLNKPVHLRKRLITKEKLT